MRSEKEIIAEVAKVNTARRNAERKRKRCIERLAELKRELEEAGNETE